MISSRYVPSKPAPEYTCFDEGQHCWDNECWKGELCLCANTDPRESCNNPFGPTPSPEPTTPGSGIECWYDPVSHLQGLISRIQIFSSLHQMGISKLSIEKTEEDTVNPY